MKSSSYDIQTDCKPKRFPFFYKVDLAHIVAIAVIETGGCEVQGTLVGVAGILRAIV